MTPMLALIVAFANQANLITNPGFEQAEGKLPSSYELLGNAIYIWTGYQDEMTSAGVGLSSFSEKGPSEGSISQLVRGIDQSNGKWLRFRFRGLAEDNFKLKGEQLYMKMEFFAKESSRDSAERLIFREVERDRHELATNGNGGKGGAAVWRSYEFEELMPFPEVDTVKLTIGFKGGAASKVDLSTFIIDDLSLTQANSSVRGSVDPATKSQSPNSLPASTQGMMPLGGNWYYNPRTGESPTKATLKVTYENASRLIYKGDSLSAPFDGAMTTWLRKGHLDLQRNLVTEDKFVPDGVVITFTDDAMVFKTKNLPNHPTAKFPDTYGTQGYNPSYIQEHADTYYLPLEPKKNDKAISMTAANENYALPMGAVGVAVNGVIFYNPFDAGMQDASSIMDRCCGHPSPDNRYHYHKYPICVNTAFVDKGAAHSPIIGFAFDGFPVYGPYESNGVMAKESKENPLNAFNGHSDPSRGWHYHVTPGKFPYIIGGYYGAVDMRNFRRGPRG